MTALEHVPFASCGPVITGTVLILGKSEGAADSSKRLPLSGYETGGIAAPMKCYKDMRPELIDAALGYLAER